MTDGRAYLAELSAEVYEQTPIPVMSRQVSQNGALSSQIENKLLTHSLVMPCALVIHGSDISLPFDDLHTMSF